MRDSFAWHASLGANIRCPRFISQKLLDPSSLGVTIITNCPCVSPRTSSKQPCISVTDIEKSYHPRDEAPPSDDVDTLVDTLVGTNQRHSGSLSLNSLWVASSWNSEWLIILCGNLEIVWTTPMINVIQQILSRSDVTSSEIVTHDSSEISMGCDTFAVTRCYNFFFGWIRHNCCAWGRVFRRLAILWSTIRLGVDSFGFLVLMSTWSFETDSATIDFFVGPTFSKSSTRYNCLSFFLSATNYKVDICPAFSLLLLQWTCCPCTKHDWFEISMVSLHQCGSTATYAFAKKSSPWKTSKLSRGL